MEYGRYMTGNGTTLRSDVEFRHERAKKANAARRNKDDSKNNDIDRSFR